MTRIAIVGAGDLGQLIAHHAAANARTEIVGFFDDTIPAGGQVAGVPVFGPLSEFERTHQSGVFDAFIMGIGYRHLAFRDTFYRKCREFAPAATIVHPSCFVDATSIIGPGSFLLPGCVIDRGCRIGENSVLNTGCVIAHDTRVGDSVFLGPGVTLAGFVDVESRAFLGVSTAVIDNVRICADVQTGGGAVVVDSLSEPGLYLGVPARRIADSPQNVNV